MCQHLESFPSDINPSVYSVQQCLSGPIYGPQPVIYGPPAGHSQSNSNLLTSINRAITFYDRNPLIFSGSTRKSRLKSSGECERYLAALYKGLSLINGEGVGHIKRLRKFLSFV